MMTGTLILLGVVFLGVWGSFARLHPTWWKRPWIRRATFGLLAAAVLGTMLRTLARSEWLAPTGAPPETGHHAGLAIVGVSIASPALVGLLALFFSLPLGALLRGVAHLGARLLARSPEGEARVSTTPGALAEPSAMAPDAAVERASIDDPEPLTPATPSLLQPEPPRILVRRRPLIELATAAIPLSFLGAGALGVGGALAATAIVARPMRFRGLHPDLEGLRILQLTDLHIGAFMDPAGLEAIVEAARPHAPDLVVLTGDICDHLPWLPGALAAIETLKPRLGILAALGNHEHYRGRAPTVRQYEASDVDLLLDASRSVRVGDAELVVSGVDDPARGGREGHYRRAIDRALDGSASAAFRLGLCHRPSGFPDLARAGVDLTLSGHTHAGQIGVGERSIFESVAKEAYLGGRYALGEAQLYTSTGGGHWFAFRLNCPSEAALVTLERA